MSRDINSVKITSNTPNVNLSKLFLAMPCLAIDKVHAETQPLCVSIFHPDRPELFVRAYSRDSRAYYMETDVDYDPRNRETFDADASFIVRPDHFFQGFYAMESVSMPGHFERRTTGGRIAVDSFQDTDEFRNAASWAVTIHHTRRTFLQTLSQKVEMR